MIAFIDLAGFSATTDIFGDDRAMAMLRVFEDIVHDSLDDIAPLKWIGDEVMLAFDDGPIALARLGALLARCRDEPRIPLTRTGIHYGSVLRRGGDVFGGTVNVASRLTALARPGEVLTTQAMADLAKASGIVVHELGERQLRSVATPMRLFSLAVAAATDPDWIDPVCKMHAPLDASQEAQGGRWFCSTRCADAYARNPAAYRD